MSSEEFKKVLATVAVIEADACRAKAEAWDNYASSLAQAHLIQPAEKQTGLIESDFEALTWQKVTPENKPPLDVARSDVNKDNPIFNELTTAIRKYLANPNSKGHTFAEKSFKYYYWIGQHNDICRREKKRN